MHPKAVEATLSREDRLDIRDLGVPDEYGRPRLTYSMIIARARYWPEDSPLATALNGGVRPFTRLERFIGEDLFFAITRVENPRFAVAERKSPQQPVTSDRDELLKQRAAQAKKRRERIERDAAEQ